MKTIYKTVRTDVGFDLSDFMDCDLVAYLEKKGFTVAVPGNYMGAGINNAAIKTPLVLPRVGDHWEEQGGIYAGITRGITTPRGNDYYLILGPALGPPASWGDGNRKANSSTHSARHDWSLPQRHEQLILFANAPSIFNKEFYWSAEITRGHRGADCGWTLNFADGNPRYFDIDMSFLARAVRRVPIEPADDFARAISNKAKGHISIYGVKQNDN